MKKQLKTQITSFLVLFLVLILTVSIASFAWFMNNPVLNISSGDNLNISVGSNIEISFHPKEGEEAVWGTSIQGTELAEGINVLDCSGDGKNFFTGEVGPDGNIVEGSMKPLTDLKGAVIEVALDVRTAAQVDLYLGSLSTILPAIEYDETNGPNNNNSLDGNFSAGWIAAAARVAFLEVQYDEEDKIIKESEDLKFVWMPNANKILRRVEYEGSYTYEMATDEERELDYAYCYDIDTYNNPMLRSKEYVQDQIRRGEFVVAQGDQLCTADDESKESKINQSPKILSFQQDGTLQVKHLLVRIWFEGYDSECTDSMLGGKVFYNFSFAGMLAKEAYDYNWTQEQKDSFKVGEGGFEVIPNGEGYGIKVPEFLQGKIGYSYDGVNYAPFNPDGHPPFTAGQRVYVRVEETHICQASTPLVVVMPTATT